MLFKMTVLGNDLVTEKNKKEDLLNPETKNGKKLDGSLGRKCLVRLVHTENATK